jgi:hypothetical protein
MSGMRIIGLILVALGVVALIYGGFTYTEEEHEVDLGPLEFEVAEKERVNVPVWAGVAAVVGGVLLLLGGRRRLSS